MQSTSELTAEIQLSDPAVLADPYPFYARLREEPIRWLPDTNRWLAADHASVVRLSRCSQSGRSLDCPVADCDRTLQRVDGVQHALLRSTVAGMFHGHALDPLSRDVARLAAELVAGGLAKGAADLMADLAHPLSTRTVAGILGLPQEDLPMLDAWTATISSAMGPHCSVESRARASAARNAILQYVERIAMARRIEPRDDLISQLIQDERLNWGEALAMIRLLLFTGSHPMALAVGNGLASLAQHPDQWELLRAQPTLMPRAVEECLRFDSVIQATSRRAQVPTRVEGCDIQAGDEVVMLLGSANRDDRVFRNAEVFDITRSPNPHLAFGRGEHTCLAPGLARLELQAVLTCLLEYRLTLLLERAIPLTNSVIRGWKRLPAHLERPAARGAWDP